MFSIPQTDKWLLLSFELQITKNMQISKHDKYPLFCYLCWCFLNKNNCFIYYILVIQCLQVIMAKFHSKDDQYVVALEHEIALLRTLKHENIVQYLGSERTDEYFNIV